MTFYACRLLLAEVYPHSSAESQLPGGHQGPVGASCTDGGYHAILGQNLVAGTAMILIHDMPCSGTHVGHMFRITFVPKAMG